MRGILSLVLAVVLLPGLALAADGAAKADARRVAAAQELTEQQMVEQARKAVAVIEKVVGEVQAKLLAARDAKDTVRANCLGERLSQAKGLLKNCKGAAEALNDAAAAKDSDGAAREYAVVKAAQTKSDEVAKGADECVGAAAEGKTQGNAYGTRMDEPGLPDMPEKPGNAPPPARPPKGSPTE